MSIRATLDERPQAFAILLASSVLMLASRATWADAYSGGGGTPVGSGEPGWSVIGVGAIGIAIAIFMLSPRGRRMSPWVTVALALGALASTVVVIVERVRAADQLASREWPALDPTTFGLELGAWLAIGCVILLVGTSLWDLGDAPYAWDSPTATSNALAGRIGDGGTR